MTNQIIKTLQDSGLSEKEAKIYVSLLELELATVFQIAKHSGLNRSSTYVVLESLKKKGLAGTSPDKPIAQYFASSPDSLLHSAQTRAKEQEEVKNNIESILPELKALHKDTKHRPKVRVYEGKGGIREAFYSVFTTENIKYLKSYADASSITKFFPEFLEYDKERAERGIKLRAISPASKNLIEFVSKNPPAKNSEILVIPEEKFRFPGHVGIYGNKVSLISMEGKFGITIESNDIADTLRNSFDLSWEEAKRLNKKLTIKNHKKDKNN